jgi:ABC-type nitrate/sulfonate/bicarbonate transport system ATPase subunit/ABC-type transporter Mla maintaining outer membrane lipid asymmetry permease subunit MlaE
MTGAAGKLLEVRGLAVKLPGDQPLFLALDLDVDAGSVVTIVGGSGAGKTTLLRALFEREQLEQSGYTVTCTTLRATVPLGLVPQHGAPFDHLDAAGNIRLALRHAEPPHADDSGSVEACLVRVDLPANWATSVVDVSQLSGGQAQRLAVARTLAGGRKLLFLDEPSAGLDPYRVRLLAKQLRALCTEGTGMVLVTHDVALASAVSDRILILGPAGLTDAFAGKWPGPLEGLTASAADKARYQQELEQHLVDALTKASAGAPPASTARSSDGFWASVVEPLGVATVAVRSQLAALRFPKDYAHVFGRVAKLAVLAPALFYGVVSMLLGFTILFVITHVAPEGVSQALLVHQIGGSYVTALAPALSAFLFVAASGNSVNAWLGGMGLTRQIAALEALGIKRERYLWAPTWLALALGYLFIVTVFAFGLLLGGLLLCQLEKIPDAWVILSSDLVAPRPGRGRFLARALWLVILYAGGIAADVVAKASREKPSAESVTQGMTASVVTCTLWVVVLELGSALWLFSTGPHG